MKKDQYCNHDCNQGRDCPVRAGTHKPAEAMHQIQEQSPATALDALREAEAALEVATARILKADPDHSISVTSEAKALVAVRAALAATPAATAQARGGELNQFLSAAKDAGITHLPMSFGEALRELEAATGTVVLPEPDDSEFEQPLPIQPIGVMGGGDARKVLWNCTFMPDAGTNFYTEQQVRALLAGVSAPAAQAEPSDNFKREVYAALGCGSEAADFAAVTCIQNLIRRESCLSAVERQFFMVATPPDEDEGETEPGEECLLNWGQDPEQYAAQFEEALKRIAPQAQAVERGEVLVTVSGFTGSGKSAIAGEIEIMCRALGLQVEWPDSDSEKHVTHADWISALEQYKPRVRIVECNVPHSVVKGQDK